MDVINDLIETVFKITANKNYNKVNPLVLIEDIKDELWTLEQLEYSLFERLLLENPGDFLIPQSSSAGQNDNADESRVIIYLFESFVRNENEKSKMLSVGSSLDSCSKITDIILRNISTILQQPEMFETI